MRIMEMLDIAGTTFLRVNSAIKPPSVQISLYLHESDRERQKG